MKNLKNHGRQVSLGLFSFLLCLIGTSCTNSDYDLDSLENLIGLGGDELVFPSSSTDTLKLADILDVNEGDCIKLNAAGDYVFYRKGEDVSPAIPVIDKVTVYPKSLVGKEVPFPFVSSTVNVSPTTVLTFNYEGQKSDEIVGINKATIDDATITVTFKFSSDMAEIKKIDHIALNFPAYMVLSDVKSTAASTTVSGSKVTLTDIPTTPSVQTLTLHVTTLDFTQADKTLGQLTMTGNQMKIDGTVTMEMTSAGITKRSNTPGTITMEAAYDAMVINSATGYFKPTINLNNFGRANVGSVPDYLRDDNVVVDLSNPQINLNVTNNMNIQGNITGVISSYKNSVATKTVTVNDIVLHPDVSANAAGVTTKASICRTASTDAGTDYYVKSDLSELIQTIPDYVTFTGSVVADETRESTFRLGSNAGNKVNLSYEINAPLAFGEKAHIIYKDTTDNWNDDIKDYSLSKDAYVNISANIENRVPAYLKLSAKAVDVNKKVLDNVNVDVTYGDGNSSIKASSDGVTSAYTPVNIKLSESTTGAMKQVDGLLITADATTQSDGAPTVVGVTLNSRNHCLIARDIVIKLVGKVVKEL
jgi:hypothetical protein